MMHARRISYRRYNCILESFAQDGLSMLKKTMVLGDAFCTDVKELGKRYG